MVCDKTGQQQSIVIEDGHQLENVDSFKYQRSTITKHGRSKKDIIQRIQQAKVAFYRKKQLLTSNKISLNARKRFLKTYIWSIALYGCETWTTSESEKKRLEAFEQWCYRCILKIKWTERGSNDEVLDKIEGRKELWKNIKRRRCNMVGHTMRHEGLTTEKNNQGKNRGKNERG